MPSDYEIQAREEPNGSLQLRVSLWGCAFTGLAKTDGGRLVLSARADAPPDLKNFLRSAQEKLKLSFYIPGAAEIVPERFQIDYTEGGVTCWAELDGFLKRCEFRHGQKGDLFGFTLKDLDLGQIPLLSHFAGKTPVTLRGVSVIFSTCSARYGDAGVEAGLSMAADICGIQVQKLLRPYSPKTAPDGADQDTADVFWVDIKKQISILTIRRAGVSYGQGKLGLALDVSASIRPFSVSLLGAGLSVDLDTKDVRFLLSGFGVAFDNGFLSIGGAFQRSGGTYAGALTVGVKTIKLQLAGSYRQGHLTAYGLLRANLGGPPAFYVTGIAAAFGYNRRLLLPDIGQVPSYPLVAAARDPGISLEHMIDAVESTAEDCPGQKFLSAGVRFTTFGLADSFLLFSVGFGQKTSFSLLGVSNLSIPPGKAGHPLAFAQLALKGELDPSQGVFSLQAQLTSESYLLDKNCHLTGGFAVMTWFGDHPNSGDFVISLGGYHPDYKKPGHYPEVPRIGVNWEISKHLSISGDAYFALTPSCMMAGVRMSAVFHDGHLKAWFIAQADFLMCWKPFHYEAQIRISLGASYTVHFLIHHTFTIELSAKASFWGPKFSGKIHISWFIISFTIHFGEDKKDPPRLTYQEFSDNFLPQAAANGLGGETGAAPLTIAVQGPVLHEKNGVKYLGPDGISFLVSSAVPVSSGDVVIRPMGDAAFSSEIHCDPGLAGCEKTPWSQQLPTALWGGEGELRRVRTGYMVTLGGPDPVFFPKTRPISLERLYQENTRTFQAFSFMPEIDIDCSDEDSIRIFSRTVDAALVSRMQLLQKLKKPFTDVSLERYARDAETLLDEDIWIAR